MQQLNLAYPQRQVALTQSTHALEQALGMLNIEVRVTCRIKSVYSIYGKMVRCQKPLTEIYDVLGIRVIVPTSPACYAALALVHSLWSPLCEQFDDYILEPKSNGYQSLHTAVICTAGVPLEIQIRSRKMHRQAEFGPAAHWRYKAMANAATHVWHRP
jgi:GTP pyrophosphokinase